MEPFEITEDFVQVITHVTGGYWWIRYNADGSQHSDSGELFWQDKEEAVAEAKKANPDLSDDQIRLVE